MNRENKVKIIETVINLGPAFGIIPGSPTANALVKALFQELDMPEVSKAFDSQTKQMEQAAPGTDPCMGMAPGTDPCMGSAWARYRI